MMKCQDNAFAHWQCGLASSYNSYRFQDAEEHFRRAIELSNPDRPDFTLASALVSYGSLLIRMNRIQEGVALIERRLAMRRFDGEDRLERRCTAQQLVEVKEQLAQPE